MDEAWRTIGESTAIGTVSLREAVSGSLCVAVQLRDEAVGGVEFLDVSEPLGKTEGEGAAVNVWPPSLEKVDFNPGGCIGFVKGGAGADVHHGRHRVAGRVIAPIGLDGVDAWRGQNLIGNEGIEIGRGESQLPPPSVSPDHLSLPLEALPHQRAGARHIAIVETLPDFGAGDGEFVLDVRGDVGYIESVSLAAFSKEFFVALPARSESVVVAHHYGGAAEPSDEDVPDKVLRTKPGERPVERLDDEVVEARGFEGLCPLIEGLEQLQPAVFAKEDLPRVWIEGEHHGLSSGGLCFIHHPAQQCLVAQVHAIKGACGHDAAGAGWEVGESTVKLHERQK